MVLDKSFIWGDVCAAHIWKFCTEGAGLEWFGLQSTDLSNPRNGLLLCKPIEEAFDTKRICFVYNPISQQFILKVLDPALHSAYIFINTPSRPETYSSIHDKPLQCPQGRMPYRRLLGFHARRCYEKALRSKWITEADYSSFKDYLSVSDGATDPLKAFDNILQSLEELENDN